jgi:hypothetical protein
MLWCERLSIWSPPFWAARYRPKRSVPNACPPLDFSSTGPLAMGIAPARCDLSSVGAPRREGLHLPAARCHVHCGCSSLGWGQRSRSPWAMQLATRCYPPSPSRPSVGSHCECSDCPPARQLVLKAHVASVYFKCFKCFKGILHVFRMDLVKVDLDIAYIAMVVHVRCKRLFVMFHSFFQTYVASVLS